MPKLDWVLCCTDGGGALALVNDAAPKIGFLEPVMERVFHFDDQHLRQKALADYLTDVQSNKVTGDDKTLALAIQPSKVQNLDWYKPTELSNGASIPKIQGNAKSPPPIVIKASPSQAPAVTHAGKPPEPNESADTINLKSGLFISFGIAVLLVLAYYLVEIFFSLPDKNYQPVKAAPAVIPIPNTNQPSKKIEKELPVASTTTPSDSVEIPEKAPKEQPASDKQEQNSQQKPRRALGPR